MKKKGFTLIELLAVIVILAIIALIATPIVMKLIKNSQRGATLRSVEEYLHAAEVAVVNENMNERFSPTQCTVKSDGDLLCGMKKLDVEISKNYPTSGTINFENGKVVSYENLYIDGQYISSDEDGNAVIEENLKLLSNICVPATEDTVTTGNVPKGKYENGDEYLCEVKDGLVYHFFIVSTDGDNVNLIVDRNITTGGIEATSGDLGAPAWVNKTDYDKFYSTYTGDDKIVKTCSAEDDYTCYFSGPQTALNQLDDAVSSWDNIPTTTYITDEKPVWPAGKTDGTYTYITDNGWPSYPSITRTAKARLLTAEEAYNNGCRMEYDEGDNKYYVGTCPLYMINYTQFKRPASTYENPDSAIAAKYKGYTKVDAIRGYWLSTAIPGDDSTGHCGLALHDNAAINCTYTNRTDYYGIRPVITMKKDDIVDKTELANGCITVDRDYSGTINLSDVITCDSESFYVIDNDGNNISMLTKYNLNVGDNPYPEGEIGLQHEKVIGSDGYGSSYGNVPFATNDYVTYYERRDGYDFFDYAIDKNYADEGRKAAYVYGNYNGNAIYPHVKKYENYLNENYFTSAHATLMSYEEAIDLGKNQGTPFWLYETTFWLGSTADYWGVIYHVQKYRIVSASALYNDPSLKGNAYIDNGIFAGCGSYGGHPIECGTMTGNLKQALYGIRPVITFSTSEI